MIIKRLNGNKLKKGLKHIHLCTNDQFADGVYSRKKWVLNGFGVGCGGMNFTCEPKNNDCEKCYCRFKCYTTNTTLIIVNDDLSMKITFHDDMTANSHRTRYRILKEYLIGK